MMSDESFLGLFFANVLGASLMGGAPMKKYSNVPMSLADACLVIMAEKLQTGRILTLDRDFEIYRWGKNRPFELLLEI